jgi:hypothetical protein
LLSGGAQEADKDKPGLSGAWERKNADCKIEFADKESLKLYAHQGDLIVLCEYTVEKDVVKAKITGLQGKEEIKEKAKDIISVGQAFSFEWKVKDGMATLDKFKSEKLDLLRSHLEGEYEMK